MSLKRKPRPEERYKFIFKKVFKKLRCNFKNSLPDKKLKKEKVDEYFYEYYFKEISLRENLPLSMFISPTNISSRTHFKTINTQYIELVKKSKLFVRDFFQEVSNSVV